MNTFARCSGTSRLRTLALVGVSPVQASHLFVNAGRKIDCLHSEAALAHLCGVGPATASFGKTRRHRLSCGGDHDERAVNREVRAGTEGAGG